MIDQIATTFAVLDIPAFTEISKILDIFTYPLLFLLWFFFLIRKEKTKALTLLITAILVIATVSILKGVYDVPRPCDSLKSKIQCPEDGAFPSGHTTAAAMFIPAFLGAVTFIPYILFYLVVAASRMYLGVHTFQDVLGGTLIGIIAYLVAEFVVKGRKSFIGWGDINRPLPINREVHRQLFHILFGLLVIFGYNYFSSIGSGEYIQLLLFLALLVGLFLLDRKMAGSKLRGIDQLLKSLERPGRVSGYGAFWLIVGLLITLSFLGSKSEILATLFVVSVSDGVATIFGRFGKQKLPYNKKKTYLGSILFFVSASISYIFIGPIALLFAIFLSVIESLPLPFDDNLTVPIAAVIFLSIF